MEPEHELKQWQELSVLEEKTMIKDILLPALMVFISGCAFGIGTTLAIDWYYRRKDDDSK